MTIAIFVLIWLVSAIINILIFIPLHKKILKTGETVDFRDLIFGTLMGTAGLIIEIISTITEYHPIEKFEGLLKSPLPFINKFWKL